MLQKVTLIRENIKNTANIYVLILSAFSLHKYLQNIKFDMNSSD